MSARRVTARIATRSAVRRGLGLVAALTSTTLLLATPATAAPRRTTPAARSRSASYNLFLGGNIGSLVTASTAQQFFANAAALWQNVQATDFPARADAIADLLADEQPDVVGLQEVANWEATSLTGDPVPSYDFLQILLDALAERGTPYRVDRDQHQLRQPAVPIQPLGVALKFTDRDVVLVRAGSAGGAVQATNAQPHTFQARSRSSCRPRCRPSPSSAAGPRSTSRSTVRRCASRTPTSRPSTAQVRNLQARRAQGVARHLAAPGRPRR